MKDIPTLRKPAFENTGQSFGKKELETSIIEYQKTELEKQGLSTIGLSNKVAPWTLNNYYDLVVADPKLAITSSSIAKNVSRIVAEKSIRSTMTHVVTAALYLFGKRPFRKPWLRVLSRV
jgi:hypothetical protein